MLNSWTEIVPLPIMPPGCAVRAKAAPVQVWSPEGRKTRWLPLLKIPLTVMVAMELCTMMLGVRITVGGAGGGEGGGEGGGGDGGGDGGGEGGGGEGAVNTRVDVPTPLTSVICTPRLAESVPASPCSSDSDDCAALSDGTMMVT